MKTTIVRHVLLCGSLVLSLSACSAAVDDVEPVEAESVEQALGGWTRLYLAPAGDTPLKLGLGTALFKRTVSGCDQVSGVSTTTGQAYPSVALPGCATITAASGPGAIVGDARQRAIYRMRAPDGAWKTIATNTGANIREIVYDGLHVYWEDDAGIHVVDDNGDTHPRLVTGDTEVALVAAEGPILDPTVYVEKLLPAGAYELSIMDEFSGTLTPLALKQLPWGIQLTRTPAGTGFTFDTANFYVTEHGSVYGGSNRLLRLAKDGSSLATLKTSTTLDYLYPLTNGSSLWWRDENLSTGAAMIRRRNLSNSNTVSAEFPMLKLSQMVLGSDGIYAVGLVQNSPPRYALERTAR